MYSSKQLLTGIANEFRILKHLGSKVTDANKHHKLSDTQRSIHELEHYIISSFPAQIKCMVAGWRDVSLYTTYSEQFDDFSFAQFSEELDNAYAVIEKEINTLTNNQRDEEITMRGMTGTRSKFLIDYVFSFLGAYKMQLFLQLKHAGLHDLGTYNLRGGVDAPKS